MTQQSPVFLAEQSDPEMKRANEQARQTFRIFWREMSWERRRIIPGLQTAAIKVAFADSSGPVADGDVSAEQMWINDVNFDGDLVHGTLLNSPNWLKSIKQGDEVSVRPERINDWMYAINDQAYGAYTVNLLRSRMSHAQRRSHDKAWGLDFGDPGVTRLVPRNYLGEEAKPIGLWQRIRGKGDVPQDPEVVAAREHPMAINMLPSFAEQLAKDPSLISAADDNGLTFLHQFALAGAGGIVALLLKEGADRNAVTHAGMTPLKLAQVLDWRSVAALLERS